MKYRFEIPIKKELPVERVICERLDEADQLEKRVKELENENKALRQELVRCCKTDRE